MATKKVKIGNVPNLRFPGFERDWEYRTLRDIAKLITKGTTPSRFVGQGIKFIKIECFVGDKIDDQKCLFIDEHTHNKELKRSILQEGDLLFAIAGATVGKVNIVQSDILPANTNQALAIIRLKEHEDSKFIYQILKSEIMRKYITDTISVGAQPNLNLEQINDFSFFQPKLAEQQKIASFLSLLDVRIQTQNKIIENLETLIKGISEKLLAQVLRFKDGNNLYFPAWRIKQLGEVLSIGNGKDYKHLGRGEIPVFGTGGLMTYVNSFLYEGETVCIGRKGTIDRPMYFHGKIWTVDTLFYTHSFIDTLPKFIFYVFKAINWKEYNEASGVPSLSKSTIEKITIKIPSISEQIKIAGLLSIVDQKVEIEQTLLVNYQRQKDFLLNKLFK